MKQKTYSFVKQTTNLDGQPRTITVVGIFEQKRTRLTQRSNALIKFSNGKEGQNGEVLYEVPITQRSLRIGYSICHPQDAKDYDAQAGIAIAVSRANRYPIGEMFSYDVTMLNEDACMALLKNEAEHIANHLEKYINA